MTQTAETTESEQREALLEEARHYEIRDVEQYASGTNLERRAWKARAAKALRHEARKLNIPEEAFLSMDVEDRVVARNESTSPPEDLDEVEDDEVPVYDSAPTADPVEPARRDGVTIGPIKETEVPPTVEDLVGDTPPRNFTDLYARWPMFGEQGGEEYHLRVERVLPKKFHGIDCEGFLANVRRKVSEAQFHRWFGGRLYNVTLYGPDPRGRRDPNGDIVIKRLTEPFEVRVPGRPPNLAVLPKSEPETPQMTQSENPYASVPTADSGIPKTPAEAQALKHTYEFAGGVMRTQIEENERLRQEAAKGGQATQHMFGLFQQQSDKAVTAVQQEASRREQLLQEQIAAERQRQEALRLELEQIRQQTESIKQDASSSAMDMMRLRDKDSQQVYQTLQAQHDALIRQLNDRHTDDLRRADERHKDTEEHWRRILDQERQAAREREQSLKDEMDRVRRDAREDADRRLADAKESYEARLRDQEKAHEREVRSMKENGDVKLTTKDSAAQFEITRLRERIEELQRDLDVAREEARQAGDPVEVLEKAKAQMEALGYQEKDADAPKSALERLAQTFGTGLQQAMANADKWMPQAAAAAQSLRGVPPAMPGQMPPPALPPGAMPSSPAQQRAAVPQQRPQRRIPQVRPRRAAQFASDGAPVETQVITPDIPMGVQPKSQEQPQEPGEVEAPANAAAPLEPQHMPQPPQDPQQVPAAPAHAMPPEQQQAQQGQPMIQLPPNPFSQVFPEEAVIMFLQRCEQSIEMSTAPADFATLFQAQYPAESRQLVDTFKVEQVYEYLEQIPAASTSPILRRDGRKWMSKLWAAIAKAPKS